MQHKIAEHLDSYSILTSTINFADTLYDLNKKYFQYENRIDEYLSKINELTIKLKGFYGEFVESVPLKKIYEFIGLDEYKNYNFNKIDNVCAETKDKAWGLDNLHAIRSKLEKTSTDPKEILGEYLSRHYDNFNLV